MGSTRGTYGLVPEDEDCKDLVDFTRDFSWNINLTTRIVINLVESDDEDGANILVVVTPMMTVSASTTRITTLRTTIRLRNTWMVIRTSTLMDMSVGEWT